MSQLGVSADDLQDTHIRFWHTWNGPAGDVIERLTNEFNTSNDWGITVEAHNLDNLDTLYNEVAAALQNASQPDLVAAYNYQALSWEADTQILVTLDDYVNDPIYGFSQREIDDFYPVFWAQDRSGRRRIGVPALRSAQLIYYNSTWGRELGFPDPPATTANFKRQACAAAQANQQDEDPTNDQTGGWIISTNYAAVLGWLSAFDSQIVQPTQRGYLFDTPESAQAFTFLRELFEDGCAWTGEESFLPDDAFARRQALFAAGSLTNIRFQEDVFADLKSKDEWTVIPFPAANDAPAITVYGPSFEILRSTPEKQLASWLFIKWLTAPQNQARLIEASGHYPLRASVLEHLNPDRPPLPQWSAAVELLAYARPEPNFASWRVVRWVVSDVATQLFRWYFTLEQLPQTLELMEETAAELHNKFPTP